MSCDIHLHVEILVDGEWQHWARPSIRGRYELFGKLAGVRDDSQTPLVAPRGFPSDASFATRYEYEYMGEDAHTPSWIATSEIIELEEWVSSLSVRGELGHGLNLEVDILGWTFLLGNSITAKWRYTDGCDYAPGADAVRFVFWFDN